MPMYDVRFANSRALRGDAEQMRTRIHKAVIGGGYKAAGEGRRGLPMYDVRRTMYDLEIWRAGSSRNFAERMQSGILKAVIGRG